MKATGTAVLFANTAGDEFIGVNPRFMVKQYNVSRFMVEGDFLNEDDPYGILLSHDLAQQFNISLGDQIELRRADVLVRVSPDIYLPKLVAKMTVRGFFDSAEIDSLRDIDGSPLIPRDPSENVWRRSQIQVIACANTDLPYAFEKLTVITQKEAIGGLAEDLAFLGYDVTVVQEHSSCLYSISGALVVLGWESAIVPIALGCLIMMVHMYQSVHERERDLAILTTIGANPSNIRNLVIFEGMTLAVLGAVGGYIFSFPLGDLVNLTLYPMSGTLLVFNQHPQSVFIGLLTSTLIAVVGSLLPIRRAIAISVASGFLKLKFQQVFTQTKENSLSMSSILPFKFDSKSLGGIAHEVDLFLDKCKFQTGMEAKGEHVHVYVWSDVKKSEKPGMVVYEISQLILELEHNLTRFSAVLELSVTDDKVQIKTTLTPASGKWRREEKEGATRLIVLLRAYFLNMSSISKVSHPTLA